VLETITAMTSSQDHPLLDSKHLTSPHVVFGTFYGLYPTISDIETVNTAKVLILGILHKSRGYESFIILRSFAGKRL